MRLKILRCELLMTFVIAAAVVLPVTSHAAVEFVTRVGACNKVDKIGDGKDLTLQAGANFRFEVWGSGIDVGNAVRVTSDDDHAGSVAARITDRRNGPQNGVGPCHEGTGSVEVEVDSPAGTTQSLQRTLHFKMPLGDESPLQIKIVPFLQPVWTFRQTTQSVGPGGNVIVTSAFDQSPPQCLTKNLTTPVVDNQSHRLVITLPAGASSDTSNCNLTFRTVLAPASSPEVDITKSWTYAVNGIPPFMQLVANSASPTSVLDTTTPTFGGSVANLRATNAQRVATLTATTPNGRSDSLTVVVNPPPVTNAFTQAVVCVNPQTGGAVNVNDPFSCEVRLAQVPPPNGQLITFEVQDRLCVAPGANSVDYTPATGVGTFVAPPNGTIHQIPLRALGGQTSQGGPCASRTGVAQVLKFWIGRRDTESGPDFSQTQIRIIQLQQ